MSGVESSIKSEAPTGPLLQDYAEVLYLAVRTAEPTVRPVYEVTN